MASRVICGPWSDSQSDRRMLIPPPHAEEIYLPTFVILFFFFLLTPILRRRNNFHSLFSLLAVREPHCKGLLRLGACTVCTCMYVHNAEVHVCTPHLLPCF